MLNIQSYFSFKEEQNNTSMILEVTPGYAARGEVKVTGIVNGVVAYDQTIDFATTKDKFIEDLRKLQPLKDSVISIRGSLIPLPGKTGVGAEVTLSLDSAKVYSQFIDEMDFVITLTPNVLPKEPAAT